MKRRTEIKIEIERSLLVKPFGRSGRPEREMLAWCAECAAQVPMLRPEEAAAVAEISVRTIYRWVEAGKLHFSETPDGLLFICFNALAFVRPG